jgi:hypothetical protein
VHRGKAIFLSCGDLLNDYEGIENHEPYRDDLVLMYMVDVNAKGGELANLSLMPFRIRNFRLNHAEIGETACSISSWTVSVGGSIVADAERGLRLLWR